MLALSLVVVDAPGFTATPAEAAPTRAARKAVRYAKAQIGKPYRWGGTGPDAFDCSGLTYMAYQTAGVSIPRTSSAQYAGLPRVSRKNLKPGDLIFRYNPVSHVGIYVGNGKVVNAQQTSRPVALESVDWANFTAAARPSGKVTKRRRHRESAIADGVLKPGERGAMVAGWQRQLNKTRKRNIAADGYYGPGTRRATKTFQRRYRLTVDGLAGPNTRAKMTRVLQRKKRRRNRVAPLADGVLKPGERGEQVKSWQRQLNKTRKRDIAVDGVYGPGTRRATRTFQRRYGLTIDGLAGPRTRARMKRLLS
ncbi:MAG: peptidoglycan-binding protein [Egibacteraceae bacterium]